MAVLKRQPCAWCDEPGMWPDGCGKTRPEGEDSACEIIAAQQCEIGDHRRCTTTDCVVAAKWFPDIKAQGIRACVDTDDTYAVVSIIGDVLTLVGTNNHLGRAKSLLRSRFASEFGYVTGDPEVKGVVYVVRGADGAFF